MRLVLCRVQVMMNMDRLLKHAVQEKLAITVCINKVSATRHILLLTPAIPSLNSPPSSNPSSLILFPSLTIASSCSLFSISFHFLHPSPPLHSLSLSLSLSHLLDRSSSA